MALLFDAPRSATVESMTYCDTTYLSKAHLDAALQECPEDAAGINKLVVEMTKKKAGEQCPGADVAGASAVPVLMWQGASAAPAQMWQGASAVPVQMWQQHAVNHRARAHQKRM